MPWFVAALCFAWATFMTFNVLTRDDGPGLRTRSGLSLSTLASASGGDGDVSAAVRAEARAAVEAELARVRLGGDVLTQDTRSGIQASGRPAAGASSSAKRRGPARRGAADPRFGIRRGIRRVGEGETRGRSRRVSSSRATR